MNRARPETGLAALVVHGVALTDTEVARFSAQRFRFPGVEINARLFRSYPYGELASHVIGYIGRINRSEKEKIDDSITTEYQQLLMALQKSQENLLDKNKAEIKSCGFGAWF